MKTEFSIVNRAFLSGLLLVSSFVPLVRGSAGQAGAAGSPAPGHVLQSGNCCGISVTVDETNLASVPECDPADASCQQGIAVCFADGGCQDVVAGSAASIRYWKQYSPAGVPQRLDVVVGNIFSHASPTATGWTQTQGPPLP